MAVWDIFPGKAAVPIRLSRFLQEDNIGVQARLKTRPNRCCFAKFKVPRDDLHEVSPKSSFSSIRQDRQI
jgi:hypothetical protein